MTELPPGELFQLCAEAPTSAAWDEFLRRYEKLIKITAQRIAWQWMDHQSSEEISDLVQNTIVKLLEDDGKALRGFRHIAVNSDFAFIKVFTLHTSVDHFKKKGARKRAAVEVELTNALGVADARNTEALIERNVLIREIDELLRNEWPAADHERDILVFWLYYRTGLTARAIADRESIGMSTSGVESLILRMTQIIRDRFRN